MQIFKTTNEKAFHNLIHFLITKGVTFEATTKNDLYIVQLTGGY